MTLKKNMQVSEQEAAQQSKFSILEYSVRKYMQHQQSLTMSLRTSRRRPTEYGMQLWGQQ